MKIRSKTIPYATMKKRANEGKEKELESKTSLTEDEKNEFRK